MLAAPRFRSNPRVKARISCAVAKENPRTYATTGGFQFTLPTGLGNGGTGIVRLGLSFEHRKGLKVPTLASFLAPASLPRLDVGPGARHRHRGWQISRSRPSARTWGWGCRSVGLNRQERACGPVFARGVGRGGEAPSLITSNCNPPRPRSPAHDARHES